MFYDSLRRTNSSNTLDATPPEQLLWATAELPHPTYKAAEGHTRSNAQEGQQCPCEQEAAEGDRTLRADQIPATSRLFATYCMRRSKPSTGTTPGAELATETRPCQMEKHTVRGAVVAGLMLYPRP